MVRVWMWLKDVWIQRLIINGGHCHYDAGCVTGAGNPYWLNDPCYAWVISVDDYCCENAWDDICQATYDYCFGSWSGPHPPSRSGIDDVILYPNPTNGVLYFSKTLDVKVYNILGKIIINENEVDEIDLSKYEPGIYSISVEYNNKIINHKIVKK